MSGNPFKIFNASAGSGKTHTLTKEYLKIVLSSPNSYGQILAITFTNKAVNEMKERILSSLFEFSNTDEVGNASVLFSDLMSELDLEVDALRKKAKRTLKDILHNYGFFDISTIDKFTHRIIRTFAKDLKIAQNFEVVLDTDLLLSEAVDKLLEKVGQDKKMTKVLMDFALEKINEDKTWDVSFDLNKIGKLLFNETNAKHLSLIKDKEVSDFEELKKILSENIQDFKQELIQKASEVIMTIENNGLVIENFKSGYFPKFMMKIANGEIDFDFNAGWKQNFETTPLYTKTCPEDIKTILDNLHPQFISIFNRIKDIFHQTLFLQNIYKNLLPLTVLNAIQKEVKNIQEERRLLSISEFNTIISNEIKNQPAPFIYERLGEKYRHYFIDEFQDTSELQWNNLVPLISNALEGEDTQGNSGSLFLVGDAKQAIYRWRGGRAEQFLSLVNEHTNPFVVEPKTYDLPSNYRSHENVIKFNNDFFNRTSPFLNNGLYQDLFEKGNQQESNNKKGGLVQMTFLEEDQEQNLDELYCEEVFSTIQSILQKSYALNEIAILVRDNKHGILLAEFLTKKGIPIVSPDSLLISNNNKVQFLINLLHYTGHKDDLNACYNILYFLAGGKENKHAIISAHLHNLDDFLKETYNFELSNLKKMSVYDGLELAIKCFDLIPDSDASVTFLLDIALEVEQKEGAGLNTFLVNWEKKKDKYSIAAPNNLNAIKIMSIHKSKGLEFPIVIFPFANSNIYKEIDPKLWLSVDQSKFNGFNEVLISKKKEVLEYGSNALKVFEEEQHRLELDAFNILYVAMTRAEKAMFIITIKDEASIKSNRKTHYSDVFIHYLKTKNLWNSTDLIYTFGSLKINPNIQEDLSLEKSFPFEYSNKDNPNFSIMTKAGLLWDTKQEKALLRGNLIHYIMGLIETSVDIDLVFKDLEQKGAINDEETAPLREKVLNVVNHVNLKKYYSKGVVVKNEKEIITKNGEILRPDRVIINEGKATIIDYKTGKENASYSRQLNSYATALEDMGYKIKDKIIAYINDQITIEYI
ncbi:UvrD-helicase domain-containing protein [Maribacter sp. HTCC2170]|uniref:UvrD-helicase domain-containing protein n=1 Tax=Maribacter sp. (strain HTCC2170 / KCCM 42371) TaxID=313603 RepID=UPI00006BD290|nr:UvrD-helicase domain-containing protein [Maribacter sp. HTCC2170]EAR02923.1 ATP-dependent helicase [Maribacter sp. HTCC2170]